MQFFLGACLSLFLCAAVFAADKHDDEELRRIKLSNRTLPGILFLYQQAGYRIVFSDSLVSDSTISEFNPEDGEPISRLAQVLQYLNLRLDFQDNTKTWYVVSANTHFVLREFVITSQESGSAIPGVRASVNYLKSSNTKGATGTTDASGKITLSIDASAMPFLTLSHRNYREEKIDIADQPETVNIVMEKYQPLLEEIIVTSTYKFEGSRDDGSRHLNTVDIQTSPTVGSDAFKLINSLPGIASTGFSAKPNIRGGAQDELLILFDGIELLDPFHLKDFQNLISGINPTLIASMDIYTGGYPARYGGKMSGVMEIHSPDSPGEYKHSLGWNPFALSATLSGERTDKTSNWIVAGRRGNLDETLEQVNPEIGVPGFADVFAKKQWLVNSGTKIDAAYLGIKDDIRLMSLDEGDGEWMRSIYDSQYGWLKREAHESKASTTQSSITFAHIKNNRFGSISEPDNPDESVGELSDLRKFRFVRVEYSQAKHYSSKHFIEYGARAGYFDGEYNYRANATLGELATLLGMSRSVNRDVQATPSGLAGSIYASYRFSPTEMISLETGLRADKQTFYVGDRNQLSPRIAVKFNATDNLTARLNAGRFYQAPGINDLDVESGEEVFHKPQKSDHYILGLTYAKSDTLTFKIETYRKDVIAPRPRYENIFIPYNFVPDIAADRIRIAPDEAEIRGFEALVEYSPSPSIRTWLSYTLSDAKDVFDQKRISRSWNQTHSFQGGINLNRDFWSVGILANWRSGWRTTNFPSYVDTLDSAIDYERNDRTLPKYFSLDVKASYFWPIGDSTLETYLEIINLTNHRNIGYYEQEINPDATNDGYAITTEANPILPIIPSIGLQWRF